MKFICFLTARRWLRRGAFSAFAALVFAHQALAGTATWNGSTGNWSDVARWSSDPNYPSNGQGSDPSWTANVGAGSASVNVSVTLQGFNLSGGTVTLDSKPLTIAGATMWTGGTLKTQGGATFTNQGTFTTNFDGTYAHGPFGNPDFFVNAGTFTKSAGTGTTLIDRFTRFQNSGTVNVNTGRVELRGGGTHVGTFNVAAGASLRFNADTNDTFNSGAKITGAGAVEFGTITSTVFNSGSAYFVTGKTTVNGAQECLTINTGATGDPAVGGSVPTAADLDFVSGRISGTGILRVTGAFLWTHGTMVGPGTTNVTGALTFDEADAAPNGSGIPDHQKSLTSGRVLNTSAAVEWRNGTIRMDSESKFNNSGTFTITTNVNRSTDQGVGFPAAFNNLAGGPPPKTGGTFTKGGTGTTTFNQFHTLTNAGLWLVNEGTLAINGNPGANVTPDAGGGHTNPGFFQSAGELRMSGGALSAAGALKINGGSLTGAGTISGGVAVTGGTIAPSDVTGSGIGKLTVTGPVTLTSASHLAMQVGGIAEANRDTLVTNSTLVVGGRLEVSFTGGFESNVTSGDNVTLVTAGAAITGTLLKPDGSSLPSGTRAPTTDEIGSFKVSYGSGSPFGADKVVLSEYAPTPLPNITVQLSTSQDPLVDGVSSLDFGTVEVNDLGVPFTLNIRNTGTQPLQVSGITIDGPNATNFATDFRRPETLQPGGNHLPLAVNFSPSCSGAKMATLHIHSNAPGARSSFDVTFTGTGANQRPVITLPANPPVVAEATGPNGASVALTATANDPEDGPRTPVFRVNNVVITSPHLFPLDDTTVDVSATDSQGEVAVASYVVRVVDTVAPAIAPPPGGFTPLMLTPGGTVPDYLAQATITDAVGVTTRTQTPAAQSVVAAGTTQVQLSATDAAGNTTMLPIAVTVSNTPPTLNLPGTPTTIYTFTKVADTATAAPVGTFDQFTEVTLSGGTVCFSADYGSASGIFTGNGGALTTIVKTGDASPVGPFAHVGNGILRGNTIAFVGEFSGRQGIFATTGGALTTIVKTGDASAIGPFTAFGDFDVSGNTVAFFGRSFSFSGIFSGGGGALTTIVRKFDTAPRGTFSGFSELPRISGGKVAFHALYQGQRTGIFAGSGGVLTTVADVGEAAPTGTFSGFGAPAISGNSVAFVGFFGSSGSGVFVRNGAARTTIVRNGDAAPVGTFDRFDFPDISGDTVAFTATLNGSRRGIFTSAGGPLATVILEGDALFGSAVANLRPDSNNLDATGNGQFVFPYDLSNGLSGVAIATPALATVLTVEATGPNGAAVNLAALATAVDAEDNPDPAPTFAPPSGSTFPVGDTTVNVSATDSAGAVAQGSFVVRVLPNTRPRLTSVAIDSQGARLSFAKAGDQVRLTFTTSEAIVTPTVVIAGRAAAVANSSGNTWTGTLTVLAGDPQGPASMNIAFQDIAGSPGSPVTGTTNGSRVTIDTIAPIFASLPPGGEVPERSLIPNYAALTTFNPIRDSATIVQTPPPGGRFTDLGPIGITLSATDLAGNKGTATIGVNVEASDIVVALAQGDSVPGAGEGGGIPAGARWSSLGVPAINASGALAYAGVWSSASDGSGIFVDETLVALAGEAAPDVAQVPGSPVTIKSFLAPHFDETGNMAFLALLGGRTVTTANDGAVILAPADGGALRLIAREGNAAPGTNARALFASILGFDLHDGAVAVQASLRNAPGQTGVKAANDIGVWVWRDGTLQPVLREGMNVTLGSATRTLKTFDCFSADVATRGMGRGTFLAFPDGLGSVFGRAIFTDNSMAVLDFGTDGSVVRISQSDSSDIGRPTINLATFKIHGIPARSATGGIAFSAVVGGPALSFITPRNDEGIFRRQGDRFAPVARESSAAPSLSGITFDSFGNAVLSRDGEDLAFAATLKGTGVTASNSASLWWSHFNSPLILLARAGTPAPGVPDGAKWKTFNSLAVPGAGYGPLILATLTTSQGGVTTANDTGLWSADLGNQLALVLREGDAFDGKTVKEITLIDSAVFTSGVSRSFNEEGQVAARLTYTDDTTAVVKINLP